MIDGGVARLCGLVRLRGDPLRAVKGDQVDAEEAQVPGEGAFERVGPSAVGLRHPRVACPRDCTQDSKLKDSGDVLNIEVTNHIFDSLKIGSGDECMVRIKTSDMIVF